MNTSEVLNTAADLIEERGWAVGSEGWGSPDGLCVEGALLAALGIAEDDGHRLALYQCPAYAAVTAYLDLDPSPALCPISDTLWGWNDRGSRTAAEVIEVLRACAVIEAAREEQDAAWETYAEVVTA
jgi:hypothetical protein